jgi:RNA polymerase-binding protein DksA
MPGTPGKKPAARRSGTARTRSAAKPTRRAGGTAPKRVTATKPPARAAAKRPTPKPAPSKRSGSKKPVTKTLTKSAPKKTVPNKTAPQKVTPKKTTRPAAVTKAASKRSAAGLTAPVAKKTAPAKTTPAAPSKPTRPTVKALLAAAVTSKGRHGKTTVICPLSGFEVTPAPAKLGAKTLERLRQKLQDEKLRLRHQAEELTAEAEQLAREREAGDTQFDEESGEGDTVNIERERDLLLSATARQVVDEIGDALERIKRGKYGVCKPAGRKISLERLEAIPWAQVCVDCKARAERRR